MPGSPGLADARAGTSTAELPASGSYVLEDLNGVDSRRIEIEGARFRLTAASGQTICTTTLAGWIGKRGWHLHLDCGPDLGMRHVDLWPLGRTGRTFVLASTLRASGHQQGGPYLMYRADSIPGSAPSLGFDQDLELLCKELGGLEAPTRDESVVSAFQRVGEQASSVVMRLVCASAMAVDPSMRHTLLRTQIERNGRSQPSCPGLERLRPSEPARAADLEVTP